VDWVVEEPFREVLEGNPLVSRLFLVRTKVWRKAPLARTTRAEIAALKLALRERSYDLVFDIQGNLKSGLACWLTGAHDRIGFSREYLQESINLCFTTRQVPVRARDRHVTDQYLRVVSVPFGRDFTEMELVSDIYTAPEDDAAAAALLATLGDGLVFLFHCGTTWPTKFWHDDGWTELGKTLLDTYPDSSLLLSWGNDAEHAQAIALRDRIGSRVRLLDRYHLKGFAALLKRVDLVVGGDTGPIHIAAAVGTPTVSLYRASDGRRSGPRGPAHAIVQSPLHCTSCFRTTCDKDKACRESITVAAVVTAVERVLK
jgi:heptosyltransferase-1